MASQELTQLTQGTQENVDPRRLGGNNSGVSEEDVSDVMCILHPATPAAFHLVAETARRAPQHILQNADLLRDQYEQSLEGLGEEETFILEGKRSNQALDLAFRFSSRTIQPHLGFMFGRNPHLCDIAVGTDAHKRVSNTHFIVYMNNSGSLMLRDTSTNGTMVDDVLLKSKSNTHHKTRMLINGTVINILSPHPQEALKFIVRIPSRQGHEEAYRRELSDYILRTARAEAKQLGQAADLHMALKGSPGPLAEGSAMGKAPLLPSQLARWNGGRDYNIVGQIGKGAFATVYQIATKSEGHLFAAKELEKRKFMKHGVLDHKLENEMIIMQSINHQSIVQYREYFETEHNLYIIMEFVPGGDLMKHLSEHGALPEKWAKQMSAQVLDALDYLHNKQITHRDIKPDNILISKIDGDEFLIKLSDFGLSKVVNNNETFLRTFCGTLLYCAPEVFPHYSAHVGSKNNKRPRQQPPHSAKDPHRYSQAVDIWSFGAVLWFAMCLKPPFEGVVDKTNRAMFDRIMMTPLDTSDLGKQGVSNEAMALLIQMLNTDPAARPSALDCLRNEWFGDLQPAVSRYPDRDLGAIAEEIEADARAHALPSEHPDEDPNFAALSIDDDRHDSMNSEVSLNSSDMDFFDPRRSKRFKSEHADFLRNESDDNEDSLDSSNDLFDSIPIIREEHRQKPVAPQVQVRYPKLFGEISKSDLNGVGFALPQAERLDATSPSDQDRDKVSPTKDQQERQTTSVASRDHALSLQQAASMVREMRMGSSSSQRPDPVSANEGEKFSAPRSARSSQHQDKENTAETPTVVPDIIPTSDELPFSRQIALGVSASIYYVPEDPATHNVEYASKVSGHDFASHPLYYPAQTSLPNSEIDLGGSHASNVDRSQPARTKVNADGEKTEASQRLVLGQLVSTSDSVAAVVLPLKDRVTTWGRGHDNTYVYLNEADTRVPRTAFNVFFYANGIGNIPEGTDFTHLPGLYCGIVTHSSNGLRINGVQLDKGEPGKRQFGKLYTGDQIEVWGAKSGGKAGMKFEVQLFHGSGVKRRSSHGPRFRVEHESSPHSLVGGEEDEKDDEK